MKQQLEADPFIQCIILFLSGVSIYGFCSVGINASLFFLKMHQTSSGTALIRKPWSDWFGELIQDKGRKKFTEVFDFLNSQRSLVFSAFLYSQAVPNLGVLIKQSIQRVWTEKWYMRHISEFSESSFRELSSFIMYTTDPSRRQQNK